MKKYLSLVLLVLVALAGCNVKESAILNGSRASIDGYPTINAKSDSLFPHLRISELHWTTEKEFVFKTLLSDYKDVSLYRLEKNARGYVTKLVFQRGDGRIFGIECTSIPNKKVAANNKEDFESQTNSYRVTDIPNSDRHIQNTPVSEEWFLSMFEGGLNRIKLRHYKNSNPIEVSRIQKCKELNYNAAMYYAQQAAICDCDGGNRGICWGRNSSQETASGFQVVIEYECGAC